MEGERIITAAAIAHFAEALRSEEKSPLTVSKYLHTIEELASYAGGREVTKLLLVAYKEALQRTHKARSVNASIAGINHFLGYMGWEDCRMKPLRIQRQIYQSEEKELTKEEYKRLLKAAEKNRRLSLVLQTICSTGIRVSEVQYFTVEAVRTGEVNVRCKGKTRTVFVPEKLKKRLLDYARKQKIGSGPIFLGKNGKAMHRNTIWAEMKKLCEAAGVQASKVFPHNLRKLFARCFYAVQKDIAKLADVLGHSSVDTTRIYIMTTGAEHRQIIEHLNLLAGKWQYSAE